MKFMKKLVSTVLAAICGMSLGVPFGVSAQEVSEDLAELGAVEDLAAAAYDPCDVNRDGVVDILDVIVRNKYLNGIIKETNYYRLDANRSRVIDAADAECVLAKVVKCTYSANYINRVYGSSDLDPTEVAVSFPTCYTTYDNKSYPAVEYSWATYTKDSSTQTCKLQQRQSNYSITPPQTGISTGNSTNTIIGSDDRRFARGTRHHEITGVVYVNGATGFIVGDHEIVTNAHVVTKTDKSTGRRIYADELTVHVCNSSGCLESTVFLNVTQVHVPTDYIDRDLSGFAATDYALIVVSDDLSDYVHFSIGNAYGISESAWANVPIYVTGKPTPLGSSGSSVYFKTGIGRVYTSSNLAQQYLDRILCYTTDTQSGASGSPVYTITKYTINGESKYIYTALAVHSNYYATQYNFGTLFTRQHELFFLNNPKDNYVNSNPMTSES